MEDLQLTFVGRGVARDPPEETAGVEPLLCTPIHEPEAWQIDVSAATGSTVEP